MSFPSSQHDPEARALAVASDHLAQLNHEQANRVIQYLRERFASQDSAAALWGGLANVLVEVLQEMNLVLANRKVKHVDRETLERWRSAWTKGLDEHGPQELRLTK